MAIKVIDTGTSQRSLDFALAKRDGWDACYVKMGGDNVGRYVAPHYRAQVDSARAAGMRVGHYWVPSAGQDPIGAADYFVDNLRGWTAHDFAVLDNESLDGAVRYGDGAAAAWINRVKARLAVSGAQVLIYSGLADARGTAWPSVLATGTNFIVAAYSYAPLQVPSIPTIPASRIVGHQYGGGPIGGVVTDTNMFVDSAFSYAGTAGLEKKELDMPKYELARQQDDPRVFWCVDRSIRHHVKDETVLNDYLYFAKEQGQILTVQEVGSIDSFGVDITPGAAGGVTDTGSLTPESIAATVDAFLKDDFAAVPKAVNDDAAKRLQS